jgi:DNA-binding LacI/PurR family transcriptional regulator
MKKDSATIQIKQIAEKLGISPGTVSIVLNGRGDEMRISKATQQRVQSMAKEMNYQPNIYARRLRKSGDKEASRVIALFMNIETTGDMIKGFYKGLWKAGKEKNYHIEYMIQFFEYDNLENYSEYMNSSLYSGLIVMGLSEKDIEFLSRTEFNLPVIVMNVSGERFSSVYVDEYQLGRECGKLFGQKGIKKAGLITSFKKGRGSEMRQIGFCQTCQEYGIELRNEWIVNVEHRDFMNGYEAGKQLIASGEKPQALFVMSDLMAIGTVYALVEAGYHMPEDIEVICYGDDNELIRKMKPSITCVSFKRDEMAEDALNLLMTIIDNNIVMPLTKIAPSEFIFRDTFTRP